MLVNIVGNTCTVIKEKGDPAFSGIVNGRGESLLLHHVKKILNAKGYDLIKKRMWKDGHLVDDLQQYLRARKATGNPDRDIYIHNSFWNIEGADAVLKRDGKVNLTVTKDVFSKEV